MERVGVIKSSSYSCSYYCQSIRNGLFKHLEEMARRLLNLITGASHGLWVDGGGCGRKDIKEAFVDAVAGYCYISIHWSFEVGWFFFKATTTHSYNVGGFSMDWEIVTENDCPLICCGGCPGKVSFAEYYYNSSESRNPIKRLHRYSWFNTINWKSNGREAFNCCGGGHSVVVGRKGRVVVISFECRFLTNKNNL